MKKAFLFIAIASSAAVSADYDNRDYNQRGNTMYQQDTNTVSDQDIRKKIQEKIGEGWFSRGYPNVSFDVNNGNVILRGSVETMDDKNKVEEKVSKIDGVRNVINQISVSQPSTAQGGMFETKEQRNTHSHGYGTHEHKVVSDQDIRKKIHDDLEAGWFSRGYPNVSYDVNNGNVMLRGSVETIEDKNRIEEKVRKIDGVRNLINQIMVAKINARTESTKDYSDSQLQESERKYPQDMASTPQDRVVNAKIRDKISDGWFANTYETIVLRTNNGFVIISGVVEKPEDALKINDKLREVEGVRGVNNQLSTKN